MKSSRCPHKRAHTHACSQHLQKPDAACSSTRFPATWRATTRLRSATIFILIYYFVVSALREKNRRAGVWEWMTKRCARDHIKAFFFRRQISRWTRDINEQNVTENNFREDWLIYVANTTTENQHTLLEMTQTLQPICRQLINSKIESRNISEDLGRYFQSVSTESRLHRFSLHNFNCPASDFCAVVEFSFHMKLHEKKRKNYRHDFVLTRNKV